MACAVIVPLLPMEGALAQTSTVEPIEATRPDPRTDIDWPQPDKSAETDESVSIAIVGGSPIDISAAPWQVLLLDFDPGFWQPNIEADFFPYCGGSIIDASWILTAAHCVDDPRYHPYMRIAAGVASTDDMGVDDFVAVDRVIIHPSYDGGTFRNDIALLELAEPLQLNSTTIAAVPLPVSVPSTWPASGTSAFTSGWGVLQYGGQGSDDLRGVDIQVLASPASSTCGGYGNSYDRLLMLCAGDTFGTKDSCSGDSGGPLVVQHNGRSVLAGVTSWGLACAVAGYPGIYTRVTAFIPWIRQQASGPPNAPAIESIEAGNRILRVFPEIVDPSAIDPVTHYAYSVNGSRWTEVRNVGVNGPIVISRLSNGRSYSVQVAAINVLGRSAPSPSVAATPLPDPPSAPTIRSLSPSNGSLQVTYRAPSNNGGGTITSYQYSLDGGEEWLTATSSSRSALIISGLENGVEQSVSIRAVNARGPGAASVSMNATPRRAPDAPTVVAVARQPRLLLVEVAAPTFNGGSAISGYEYSLNNGRWTRSSSGISPSFQISRVTDSRSYTLRVRAVNAAGGGSPSDSVSFGPLVP